MQVQSVQIRHIANTFFGSTCINMLYFPYPLGLVPSSNSTVNSQHNIRCSICKLPRQNSSVLKSLQLLASWEALRINIAALSQEPLTQAMYGRCMTGAILNLHIKGTSPSVTKERIPSHQCGANSGRIAEKISTSFQLPTQH